MAKPELQDTTDFNDLEYQDYILQHVSRTFALTIPQLPQSLVPVIGNAYLLCRIADTIEDDADLEPSRKRDFSQQYLAALGGQLDAEVFADQLAGQLSPATPAAERDLVLHIPQVLRITQGFSEREGQLLFECVRIMSEGMSSFQEQASARGLENLAELNSYCYHVAGVVGEMLTELFCNYSVAINNHRDELLKLAVSFGQGLQMTNILKDSHEDYARGVCWLPRDICERYGVELSGGKQGSDSEMFARAMTELVAIAHGHLIDALRFTLLLPRSEKGLRKFCLWAIGMAVMTLRKINQREGFQSGNEVKITRRTVRGIVVLSNLSVSHDRLIRWLFRRAAGALPEPIPNELDVTRLVIAEPATRTLPTTR